MRDFAVWSLSDTISYSGLAAFDGRAADFLVAAGPGSFLQSDLGEERRHLVVLVLRPAFEGMIVALVAVEADGQEQMRGVLHRLLRSRGESCSTRRPDSRLFEPLAVRILRTN